jgi:5'-nucleotidase
VGYSIADKLVVAVSSTALFDFTKEHEIFLNEGVEAFRQYQRDNRHVLPKPGAAFPFIKRLLHLNKVFRAQAPVEVILLSRNDPEAGLRMMDALPHYELDISRAFFRSGEAPYPYMKAVNACLYLSTDHQEVREAIDAGHPAGHVLPCAAAQDDADTQLRIAFDFDGVIVDDEAESQYASGGLPLFHHHEVEHRKRPLNSGPLMPLMRQLSKLQRLQRDNPSAVNTPGKAIRVAIVTARSMPAHERIITTLQAYDIEADELFLTGGLAKKDILDVMRPQIFFDDQLGHLEPAAEGTPCVHIPFGVRNRPAPIELPEVPAPKRSRARKPPAERPSPSPRLGLDARDELAADA